MSEALAWSGRTESQGQGGCDIGMDSVKGESKGGNARPLSPASWLRSHILWDSVPVGRGARWGGAAQLPALVRRYFRNARTMRNSGRGRLFLKGRAVRIGAVAGYSAGSTFEHNIASTGMLFLER